MKSKYETHVEPKLFLIECWARDGVIDEDIAKKLGIVYSTLREYKKKYSALSAVLKKGKEVIDFEVENALLKRAKGYEYEEIKTSIEKGINDKENKKVEKTTKHMPPDVTAQIYWLKNRKMKEWQRLELERLEVEKQKLAIEKEKLIIVQAKSGQAEEETVDNSYVDAFLDKQAAIVCRKKVDDE